MQIDLKKFRLTVENIDVRNNEKVLINAPNSSGKSIFMLGMTGLIRARVRNIFYNDIHCDKNRWQEITGVYHDQSSLVPFLTPFEFFKMTGGLKGTPRELVVRNSNKYCDYFNFHQKENKYIKELSLGTQKKAGLIASLLSDPSIVLWDEPFANLDDESTHALTLIIEKELENTSVLLTSPTRELPYKKFTSQLIIENGIVHKVPNV